MVEKYSYAAIAGKLESLLVELDHLYHADGSGDGRGGMQRDVVRDREEL